MDYLRARHVRRNDSWGNAVHVYDTLLNFCSLVLLVLYVLKFTFSEDQVDVRRRNNNEVTSKNVHTDFAAYTFFGYLFTAFASYLVWLRNVR